MNIYPTSVEDAVRGKSIIVERVNMLTFISVKYIRIIGFKAYKVH